MVEPMVYLLAV
jgi:hypothetical protein